MNYSFLQLMCPWCYCKLRIWCIYQTHKNPFLAAAKIIGLQVSWGVNFSHNSDSCPSIFTTSVAEFNLLCLVQIQIFITLTNNAHTFLSLRTVSCECSHHHSPQCWEDAHRRWCCYPGTGLRGRCCSPLHWCAGTSCDSWCHTATLQESIKNNCTPKNSVLLARLERVVIAGCDAVMKMLICS